MIILNIMKTFYKTLTVLLVVGLTLLIITEKHFSNSLINTNIEALAQSETGRNECYHEFKKDPDESEIYCQTCQPLPGRARDKSNCFN
jgi:hypothetical protein